MASKRKVNEKTARNWHRLLDCVEELMVESGYSSVTYRAVAARAGVGASYVQYHFRTLDELLVATVRRRTDQSLEHLKKMLRDRPDDPLRVVWEFSGDETTAALAFEFSALGNHNEAVRSVTVAHMQQLRKVQLDALAALAGGGREGFDALPTEALLFVLSGIPKLIAMELSFDVDVGHRETVDYVERYLDERARR